MPITDDKVVSIIYDLKIPGQEEIIESVTNDNPLKFIPGRGYLLQSFEDHLKGLVAGN